MQVVIYARNGSSCLATDIFISSFHLEPLSFVQSYGRVREQGKVLQTFVQNVVPGSVSFMAGLYPGDAIVAINGENVKYAPINEIYKSIKNASKGKER